MSYNNHLKNVGTVVNGARLTVKNKTDLWMARICGVQIDRLNIWYRRYTFFPYPSAIDDSPSALINV